MAKVIGRIDGDGRLRPRILFALGLLVDVVALGGMGLAIALTSARSSRSVSLPAISFSCSALRWPIRAGFVRIAERPSAQGSQLVEAQPRAAYDDEHLPGAISIPVSSPVPQRTRSGRSG